MTILVLNNPKARNTHKAWARCERGVLSYFTQNLHLEATRREIKALFTGVNPAVNAGRAIQNIKILLFRRQSWRGRDETMQSNSGEGAPHSLFDIICAPLCVAYAPLVYVPRLMGKPLLYRRYNVPFEARSHV